MKAVAFNAGSGLGLLMGAVVAYVVWASVKGVSLPVLSTPRGAFWGVAVLGVAMCAVGGIGLGLARSGNDWLDPFMLAGIVLGVLALALIVAVVLGVRVPMIADDRTALLVLAGLVAAKVVVASAHGLFALAAR